MIAISRKRLEELWKQYEHVHDGKEIDPDNCGCPYVVFENEDGRCSHRACEGNHPDCGEPVEIVDR